MKVVISAAGTGGHINPGIAIANKIMEEDPNSEVIFIGTPTGLENDLVPRAGYELKTLEAYGIKKKNYNSKFKEYNKNISEYKFGKKIYKRNKS